MLVPGEKPPVPLGSQMQVNIPMIELSGISFRIAEGKNTTTGEAMRGLILGPLCLVVPLDADGVRTLHDATRTSGIEVPRVRLNGDAA